MFQVNRSGPNHLDIDINGRVDSKEMQELIEEIKNKAEGVRHGTLICRFHHFELPTLGAIGVELSHLPTLFHLSRQFDKVAVVTDKHWLQRLSELEGTLIPGLVIKGFDRDQEQRAVRWIENGG